MPQNWASFKSAQIIRINPVHPVQIWFLRRSNICISHAFCSFFTGLERSEPCRELFGIGISDAWKLHFEVLIAWFFINFKISCFLLQIWRIFKSVFVDIQNLQFDCKAVLISNVTSVVLPRPSDLLWNYLNAKKICRNNHESTLSDNIVQFSKLNLSFVKTNFIQTRSRS